MLQHPPVAAVETVNNAVVAQLAIRKFTFAYVRAIRKISVVSAFQWKLYEVDAAALL